MRARGFIFCARCNYWKKCSFSNVPKFIFSVCVGRGMRAGNGKAGNCKTLIIDNPPLFSLCSMLRLLYVIQGN